MICFAKFVNEKTVYLRCDGETVKFDDSEWARRWLYRFNCRYGSLLLVHDGFRPGRYDNFVRLHKGAFYLQILSIPQMFYAFESVALPTMRQCAEEAGVGEDLGTIEFRDTTRYLEIMEHVSDWAHANCVV